jgi:hypothetical protein
VWRIVIPDQNHQMVNFVCEGTQQFQGRDVAVLALTTTRTTQNGVGPVSGSAFIWPNGRGRLNRQDSRSSQALADDAKCRHQDLAKWALRRSGLAAVATLSYRRRSMTTLHRAQGGDI